MNQQSLRVLVLDRGVREGMRLSQTIKSLNHEPIVIQHVAQIRQILKRVDIVIVADSFRHQLPDIKHLIPDAPIALAGDMSRSLNGQASYVQYRLSYPYHPNEISNLCQTVATKVIIDAFEGIIERLDEMVANPDRADSLDQLARWIVKQVPSYQAVSIHLIKKGVFECRTIESTEYNADARQLTIGINEGYFGTIRRERRIFAIIDLSKAFTNVPIAIRKLRYRSLIAIPMMIRNDVIGVLTCYSRNPLNFSPRHEAKLRTLTNLAALEAYNEWQVRERGLKSKISKAWQQADSRAAVINIISDTIDEVADSQGAAVCLYSADSHRYLNMRYKRETGLGADLIDWDQSTDQWRDFHEYVFQQGFLIMEDVHKASHRFPEIRAKFIAHGVHAFIALPLLQNNLCLGMLFVFYNWEHPYTIDDPKHSEQRDGLALFHQQAILAVRRAYEQERHRRSVESLQNWTRQTYNGLPLADASPRFWERFIRQTIINADFGADQAAIVIFEGSSEGAYKVNMRSAYLKAQLALDRSMENDAKRHKKTILATHIAIEADSEQQYTICDASSPDTPTWHITAPQRSKVPLSKLVVPILYHERLLGLIILESFQYGLNSFDADHFEQLAHTIGLTLHDQNPVSKLMLEAEKLPALQPIREDIERISNDLLASLSADLVSVLLYSPYWDSFQIPITSGTMNSVVLPYSPVQVRELMWDRSAQIQTDTTRLQNLTPGFYTREAFKSACAICFYNEDRLPVGTILVHWRTAHTVSDTNAETLKLETAKIATMVIRNYTFNRSAEVLRNHLGFDLVRLHLFKQDKSIDELQSHSGLRWAAKPVTKGTLKVPRDWQQRKAAGPIAATIDRYLTEGELYGFYNNTSDSHIANSSTFTAREGVKSGAHIVLVINQGEPTEEIMGVLFVNWRVPRQWTQAEKTAVLSYARHMALAIHNRRMMNTLKVRGISENWIQELFGLIIRDQLDRAEALDRILETACLITGAHFGDIRLKYDDYLITEAVKGEPAVAKLYKTRYRRLGVNGIGLTCRAFRADKAIIFSDVSAEYDYIQADTTTRSEMVVVIRQVESGERIGTINLEHRLSDGFNHHDKQHLISIADVTAVILQSIEQFTHLQAEQKLFHMFEEVAVDGIIGKNWQHSAHQKDFAIRAHVTTIYELLNKRRTPKDKIRQSLQRIEQLINEFAQIPANGGLSREFSRSIVVPTMLDTMIKSYTHALCASHDTKLHLDLNCEGKRVAIDKSALQAVLEKLVRNSLEALESLDSHGTISIYTYLHNTHAEITIKDNGPGISAEVRRYYLRSQIPNHLRTTGMGAGAIIALFILRNYKGKLEYVHNADEPGACHRLLIPLADSSEELHP